MNLVSSAARESENLFKSNRARGALRCNWKFYEAGPDLQPYPFLCVRADVYIYVYVHVGCEGGRKDRGEKTRAQPNEPPGDFQSRSPGRLRPPSSSSHQPYSCWWERELLVSATCAPSLPLPFEILRSLPSEGKSLHSECAAFLRRRRRRCTASFRCWNCGSFYESPSGYIAFITTSPIDNGATFDVSRAFSTNPRLSGEWSTVAFLQYWRFRRMFCWLLKRRNK